MLDSHPADVPTETPGVSKIRRHSCRPSGAGILPKKPKEQAGKEEKCTQQ